MFDTETHMEICNCSDEEILGKKASVVKFEELQKILFQTKIQSGHMTATSFCIMSCLLPGPCRCETHVKPRYFSVIGKNKLLVRHNFYTHFFLIMVCTNLAACAGIPPALSYICNADMAAFSVALLVGPLAKKASFFNTFDRSKKPCPTPPILSTKPHRHTDTDTRYLTTVGTPSSPQLTSINPIPPHKARPHL